MKKFVLLIIVFSFLKLLAQPTTITYQGILTDENGDPINGTRNVSVEIFDSQTGGSSLWTESHSNVDFSEGLFNIELGSNTSLSGVDFSDNVWLEITVESTTLSPRIAFNASGYTFSSKESKGITSDNNVTIETTAGNSNITLTPDGAGRVLTTSDLINDGSMQIGTDSDPNYTFGYNTFVMSENNLRLLFDDTSNSSFFPDFDWQLEINSSINGGTNHFAVNNMNNVTTPLFIDGSAVDNSIYAKGSYVGLGTSSPGMDLHILSGDSPAIRFQQDNTSGWTPYTWDVAGNEVNFFVRDVSGITTLPFRIFSGNSDDVLVLRNSRIGIGTNEPARTAHINGVMRLEPQSSAPSSPSAGDIYFDSNDNKLKCYDGTTWQDLW